MAQSVELLLAADAEEAVRQQWHLLAEAGLTSEHRSPARMTPGSEHHRPHITLFAGDTIAETVDQQLTDELAGLELELELGSLLVFGPRHGRVILVRQVTPSVELLALQARVAAVCQASSEGQFGPGRWSPHVTLAMRLPTEQLGTAIEALGRSADRPVRTRVTQCRRWDGARKTAWLL